MFEEQNPQAITTSQNAPAFGYTATQLFGNMDFSITAPQPMGSKVQSGYPTLQYISLADEIWFQNVTNPNDNPTYTLSGSNTGEQVTSGQITQQDATGTTRLSQGTQLS